MSQPSSLLLSGLNKIQKTAISLSICPSQEMLEKATSSSVPKITLRVLMTKLLVYILKLYRFIALKTFFNGTWTWWHGGNLKSTSYPNTTAN